MRSREQANSTGNASATAAAADMQFRASAPPHITQLRSLLTGESGFGPRCRWRRRGITAVVRTWVRKYSEEILPVAVHDSYGRCENDVALSDQQSLGISRFIVFLLPIYHIIFDLIVVIVSEKAAVSV